jgi:hypothetical protein
LLSTGIISDEDDRKPRLETPCHQFRHVAGDSRPQIGRYGLAVDDVR